MPNLINNEVHRCESCLTWTQLHSDTLCSSCFSDIRKIDKMVYELIKLRKVIKDLNDLMKDAWKY